MEGEEKRVRSRVLLDPEYWGFGDYFVLRCNDQFAWILMVYFERSRGTIITGVRARISSMQEGPGRSRSCKWGHSSFAVMAQAPLILLGTVMAHSRCNRPQSALLE